MSSQDDWLPYELDPNGLSKLATNIYSPGNKSIPSKGPFEDTFPFPKAGYLSSLEGIYD